MRRRDFITLFGGASVVWPFAARAQQGASAKRVGVLTGQDFENDPSIQIRIGAFREGLAKLGWTEERNLRLDFRFGGGDSDRIRAYAAELVRLAPDAIVSVTRAATLAVQEHTHTTPIIIAGAGDVATNGLVRNVAHPEANITGVTNLFGSIGGKWLELLKEAVPSLSRVSFVESQFAIEGRVSGYRPSIGAASHALSVEMVDIQYRSAVQLVRAIDAFAAQPNGGLIVGPATTRIDTGTILELAAQYRLPTIGGAQLAENGGLISYGGNSLDTWGRAPFFVDRILRGAKVSELPVEFPTKFQLVVNLKTAKAIGLIIPESLLSRADEVIE
jgi:putative ABC transport system substrate-binding protein